MERYVILSKQQTPFVIVTWNLFLKYFLTLSKVGPTTLQVFSWDCLYLALVYSSVVICSL